MIGKLFNNRYLIQEKLGSGGTAIVYKGQDTLLNRMVTVKILREEYASNDEFVRRFRREAQAVASLSHGNIVAVYDVGYEENMHYIVMEFVEGQSLKEYIKEKGALPVHIAAAIMMQVLDGIGYAHEHSIIHRDIKPHNILLGKDGRAKVTDFGIAVGMTDMTQTYNTSSRIMGSVHYIAPEQVQGQPVAEKSDIYSAGVVFYEMLTGQLPFTGDTPISIAMQHVQGELILPHQLNTKVPMGLSYVVMRAMRKNPDTRYDNAQEMMEAIRSVTEGLNSVFVPPPEEGAEANFRKLKPPFINRDEEPYREKGKRPHGIFKGTGQEQIPPERLAQERFGSEDNLNVPHSRETIPQDYRRELTAPRRRVSVMSIILVLLLLVLAGTMVWAIGIVKEWVNSDSSLTGPSGMFKLPDVVGLDFDEAATILMELDLTPTRVPRNDEVIPINEVMIQSPSANSNVKAGDKINLTISDGPRLTEVPGVIGDSEAFAKTKIKNKGLVPDFEEPEYSDDFLAGEVIRQEPTVGARVQGGSTVLLTLSLGPEPIPVTVPKLVEKTFDEAKKLLEDVGLRVGKTDEEESLIYEADIVIKQSVAAGNELNERDTVDLVVSIGPGPQAVVETPPSTYLVSVDIPDDGMTHRIYIVVIDAEGTKEKFNQTFSPNYPFRESIPYVGSGTINVYMDDILIESTPVK